MTGARTVAEIASYHAHVYFDSDEERRAARDLRERVAERFRVRLGHWHDRAIGPHGSAMYQIAFSTDLFATLVPWLMLNHRGLSILVHANTTRPLRDHVEDAMWIGTPVSLAADALPAEQDEAGEAGAPNTSPTLTP